jgi:ceramide glucosyltransferase
LGLIFTEGTTTSLLFLILSKGYYLAWITLISTWSLRLLMAWIVGVKKLKDSVVQKAFCLIPLRDLVGFIIWCYGFVGNKIEWRGKKFRLSKDGVMSKK